MNDEFNKIVAKELMLLRKNADMSNEKLAKKQKLVHQLFLDTRVEKII